MLTIRDIMYFSTYRLLADTEHVGKGGPLGFGQDGADVMYCVCQWQQFSCSFQVLLRKINNVELLY